MKTSVVSRLKAYSLSASSIAAGLGANAQILYTDVNPDITIDMNNSIFELDLDNNNVPDFELQALSFYYVSGSFLSAAEAVNVSPLSSNGIAVEGGYYTNYPYDMSAGAPIGPALFFNSFYTNLLNGFFLYSGPYGYYYSPLGNWPTNLDRYLGLRVNISGQQHYGWARIEVLGPSTMVLKDYAIQLSPNTPLNAGDTVAAPLDSLDSAFDLIATDINDNGNGSDIQLSFTKAPDETDIQEYRVIAVKTNQAASFSVSIAQSMTGSQYIGITPNGNDITTQLTQTSTDSDGDPITTGQPYQLFVYNVGNPQFLGVETLSPPSNTITLGNPVALDQVVNVQLFDIDDQYDERDLRVQFNALNNETGLEEYRVIIAPTEIAFTFDLNDASLLPSNSYTAVQPSSSTLSSLLNNGMRDAVGNPIQAAIPYRAFIYAAPDGSNATIGSLSAVSNEVILNPPLNLPEINTNNLDVTIVDQSISIEGLAKPIDMKLIDMMGRTIMQCRMEPFEQKSLHHLTPGVYIIQLEFESSVINKKISL